MNPMLRKYQAETQQVLNDLFVDKMIPIQLTAHKVTEENRSEIRIHFYDSRLHSVIVELRNAISIKQQVRESVLRLTNNELAGMPFGLARGAAGHTTHS